MVTESELVSTLRTWGRQSASTLLARLSISRATLMRAVRAAGDQVVTRGKARRTTYAARRPLRGRSDPIPLYRVDETGTSHPVALVHLTYPAGCAAEFVASPEWPLANGEMADGWFEGLPYPLYDARPQGFLGRHFAREHAALLQVDENPERWSDDDVLHALTLFGSDAPGNLILGDTAHRRWLDALQSPAPAVADHELSSRYIELAEQALLHGTGGSSAGGEFPKFTTTRLMHGDRAARNRIVHVLVKFSGSDAAAGTRRWSDLLVCEHLASEAQREHLGIAAAQSRIHQAGGRTFLEVVRFDRHGAHGRSGVCSWTVLNAALLGTPPGPWPEATGRLLGAGLMDRESHAAIARQWHFGRLIANTDMHDGNLSFEPARAGQASVRVSPAYDMLPMLYAPARGVELVPREYVPQLPLPAQREAWHPAARAAHVFWQTASEDRRISRPFRAVCRDNAAALYRLIGLTGSS